jgi:HlyD family secretion protein
MDKISLALRVAQESFNAAEAGQRETLVRKEDIHAAEAAIEQLHAAIEAAKAMREKTIVRAPFDGIITRVLLKRGEAVAMGLPLLEIVSPANNYIEAPFDEVNAAKIKVGQRARITLDAYPGKEFDGEVSFVSPVVNLSLERSRTLTAKIRATNQPEIFLPGMSAEVTILVQTKDDVLYIPTESVIRDEYVYVLAGGKAVRRTVKLGIGNWERHEVLSGIGAGDTLITSVAIKGIADGVAVRAVDSLE